MSIDYEIFEGKSLSSLFEDIYKNTEYNRKQLDVLTKELVQFIKDGDTAVQIVPMIKEYLEINVRNDDQLVKMAGIVQRLISAEGKAGSEDEYGLSDEEKQQLLSGIEDTIKDIQKESDKITKMGKFTPSSPTGGTVGRFLQKDEKVMQVPMASKLQMKKIRKSISESVKDFMSKKMKKKKGGVVTYKKGGFTYAIK